MAIRNMNWAAGIPLLAVYTGSITAANWLTTRYGLVPVAPGLTATAGTFAVGGVIMTRDLLQDALGLTAVILAITAGAAISYGLSSHRIALASGLTFLLAETLEFTVYTPLRRRCGWGTARWSGTVAAANATGAIADTLLFLALAGIPMTAAVIAGQFTGKAYVTIAAIALGTVIRHALPDTPVNAAGA
jgi:uncharacterized PurR-regulated membrane protein YhhQ (DUF165 family)